MSTLSFLGNVNIAIRIVQEEFPGTKLYEVDLTSDLKGPTTDVKAFTNLRVVFPASEGNTVFITSKPTWGEWNAPVTVHSSFVGDRVVPWPIKLELTAAHDLLVKAGYDIPFSTITLRWTLYPGVDEPHYIFGTEKGFIFVGVYTHKVTTDSSGE